MTHNDYTKLMLNIKDDNIYFYDNLLTTLLVKLNATLKIIEVASKWKKTKVAFT